MADTVNSQLYDGIRNVQLKYTIYSDGTGQTGVKIIDVTTLHPNPGVHMKLRRLRYSIEGMYVRLQWDASTPIDIAVLGGGTNILDFSDEYAGGWPNNGGAGVTGSILLTTTGSLAGSNATLVLECIKGV